MKMQAHLVLLRGINVGGQNPISMTDLRERLETMGYQSVRTYIQSGNIVLDTAQPSQTLARHIEERLAADFKADRGPIKALALSSDAVERIMEERPPGFGDEPDKYHSDAIFLMDIDMTEALSAFSPREGVDALWPGRNVIYHQRLSALRTKTRLNRMMASPLYRSMTIRSWSTMLKLQQMLQENATNRI
jgi:uncharacterized protein (DUF1697 family)